MINAFYMDSRSSGQSDNSTIASEKFSKPNNAINNPQHVSVCNAIWYGNTVTVKKKQQTQYG